MNEDKLETREHLALVARFNYLTKDEEKFYAREI